MIRNSVILLLLIGLAAASALCPVGTYWDQEGGVCVGCRDGCQGCDRGGCWGEDRVERWGKRRIMLTVCGDAECKTCANSTCTECIDGYASNGGSMNCQPCHATCVTCARPNNDGQCSSCASDRYLNPSNYCILCNTAFTAQCIQCTQAQCTNCVTNYYPDPAGPNCVACSTINNCTTCNAAGCTGCQPYYQLLPNRTCSDICGDSYVITLPCDNPIGIPYDGCQLMPDFTCGINGTSNICSYAGLLKITQISLTKPQFENKLQLVVQLFPPLYAFTNTNLAEMFFINDTDLHIQSMEYVDGKLKIMISFTTDVVDRPFQLMFQPGLSTDPRFYVTPPTKLATAVSTSNTAYYYSSTNFIVAKIVPIFCYILVGLTWLIFLIAIFSKKLAGLELIFILQYAWVTLFWLPGKFPLPYLMTVPLKYSSGYGLPLSSFSHDTALPIQSKDFNIDSQTLSNNFNLILVLYAIPVIGMAICKLLTCCQKYKASASPKLQFFMQLTLYAVMANLIGLTLFAFLFFNSSQLAKIPSLVIFSLSALITVSTLIKFFIDPDPFDRFRYSFNNQFLAFNHYYLHVINLVAMVLLLGFFNQLYWVCCIPVGLLLIETLAYRPYKELIENFRSAFYHLLMLLTAVLRLLYCMNDYKWHRSDLASILLVVLICGLYFLAVVWAYIQVFRDICCKQTKMSEEKQKLQYTLFQDLKLMKQISNPQKFMELTGLNPLKPFPGGFGGDTSRHSDAQSYMQQQNQQFRLKSKPIKKVPVISQASNGQKNYPETGHTIKISTPKILGDPQNEQTQSQNKKNNNYSKNQGGVSNDSEKNLETDRVRTEGDCEGQGESNNLNYDENDIKIVANSQYASNQMQEIRPAFKMSSTFKPVFQSMFTYGLPLSPMPKQEQTKNDESQKPAEKQNEFEQMDQMKKMMIRKVIKNQIQFLKIKNAEELTKPKDEKLLSIYEQI